MHEAFVLIVVNAIRERYLSEKAFYTQELGISGQSWTRWKNGERGLKSENMQKISMLFTDYEWMLAHKIARNAEVLPEVASDPVAEYLRLKEDASKLIVQEFEDRLKQIITHKDLNRKISYQYLVRLECYKLIKHLLGEKKYKSFQMWW